MRQITEEYIGSKDVECLCSNLISSKMKSFKYLKLNFESYWCGCERSWDARSTYVDLKFDQLVRDNQLLSNLETIIIGDIPSNSNNETTTKISFYTLNDRLLPCLPKLKHLMVNAIHFDQDKIPSSIIMVNENILLNIKTIQLWNDMERYASQDVKQIRRFLRNVFVNNNSNISSQ